MSKRKFAAPALLASTALFLAACAETETEEPLPVDETVTELPEIVMVGPMDQDVELDEEQQARFDAMDREAATREYRDIRIAHMEDRNGENGVGATTQDRQSTDSADTTDNGQMMDPYATSFEKLDYNDDDQLSVAEFAIFAMDVNPNVPKPNDEKGLQITADQLNRAAEPFFSYDTDGDSYLNESEFEAAKLSMAS